MVKKLFALGLFGIFLISLASALITSDLEKIISENSGEEISVIISFRDFPTPSYVQELVNENAKIKYEYKIIDAVAAKVPANAIERISKKAFVESIEPDYEVKLVLDKSIYEIGAEKVWDNEISGRGINVAVLDTGIFSHNVLAIIKEVDFTGEGTEDLHGHGTHVAGIVASQDSKYKGVAYGAGLFNVKVLNKQGSGSGSDVIKGIEWAVDNGANIISLSLGAKLDKCDGRDAISRAVDKASEKLVVVVAAGNFGPDAETITSPGCATGAITIGATDGNSVASFSSRGPTADGRVKPDLVAPGVRITSTWLNNEFRALSGTSMATPHISGVVALLLEINSQLKTNDLKEIFSSSADDLGLDENTQGKGKVNAYSAYLIIAGETEKPIDEPVDEPIDEEPKEDEEKKEKTIPGLDRKLERGKRPQGVGYGLSRAMERIQLTFSFNRERKAELHLKFAERRLSESLEIINEDEKKAEELLEDYEKNLERANKISEIARQLGRNTTKLTELIAEATSIHEEVLREVLEKVPEQAKPAIERAINNSRVGNENALNAIGENNPERAAEMHLEIAERKVEQMRERIEKDKTENGEITREIEERLKKAEEVNGNIGEEKKKEILEKVSEATERHKEVLEESLERVPDEAKPAIEKAIERANEGKERATQAIEKIPATQETREQPVTPVETPSVSPTPTPAPAQERGVTGRIVSWVFGRG